MHLSSVQGRSCVSGSSPIVDTRTDAEVDVRLNAMQASRRARPCSCSSQPLYCDGPHQRGGSHRVSSRATSAARDVDHNSGRDGVDSRHVGHGRPPLYYDFYIAGMQASTGGRRVAETAASASTRLRARHNAFRGSARSTTHERSRVTTSPGAMRAQGAARAPVRTSRLRFEIGARPEDSSGTGARTPSRRSTSASTASG